MGEQDTPMCIRCGHRQDQDTDAAVLLSWSAERTTRGTRWLCPRCARAHVRDIEGKLPDEYW